MQTIYTSKPLYFLTDLPSSDNADFAFLDLVQEMIKRYKTTPFSKLVKMIEDAWEYRVSINEGFYSIPTNIIETSIEVVTKYNKRLKSDIEDEEVYKGTGWSEEEYNRYNKKR